MVKELEIAIKNSIKDGKNLSEFLKEVGWFCKSEKCEEALKGLSTKTLENFIEYLFYNIPSSINDYSSINTFFQIHSKLQIALEEWKRRIEKIKEEKETISRFLLDSEIYNPDPLY